MVPSDSDILPEYRGVTGTSRGKYWALVGLSGERGGPQGVPPHGSPNWTRGGGGTPLSLSLSSSFLFPSGKKGKGGGANPTRSGVLVGLPPMARPSWPAASSSPPLYMGAGAPHSTSTVLLAVCDAPLHSLLLGHNVIMLRRSPARITSPSPSPHRCAEETLPRPSAGSIVRGMSSR